MHFSHLASGKIGFLLDHFSSDSVSETLLMIHREESLYIFEASYCSKE